MHLLMSRTNTLGNRKATAPRTSPTRYPKGLLQVLQGSSTQGPVTLMGARQAELRPVTMLSSMSQSCVAQRHPSCPASMADCHLHTVVSKEETILLPSGQSFPAGQGKEKDQLRERGNSLFLFSCFPGYFSHSASIVCFKSY